MGFVDFVQNAGRHVGLFGGRKAAEAERAREAAEAAAKQAEGAADADARQNLEHAAVAADIRAAILSYVPITELNVQFDGNVARVSGRAASQADKEKAVLVAGNTRGVARVDDRITVQMPAPPATYHTVVRGDTLSAISARYYGGILRLYDVIFEANRPMLTDPDEIEPGQTLRIPPVKPPVHVVARGETLRSIAQHWFGDPSRAPSIAAHNRLADPDRLEVGQRLVIPMVDPVVAPLA